MILDEQCFKNRRGKQSERIMSCNECLHYKYCKKGESKYFESEEGAETLNKISAGTTLPSLSSSQLNTLIIPIKQIEEQRQIAMRYKNSLNEIKALFNKIEEVELQMKQIFITNNKIIQ